VSPDPKAKRDEKGNLRELHDCAESGCVTKPDAKAWPLEENGAPIYDEFTCWDLDAKRLVKKVK